MTPTPLTPLTPAEIGAAVRKLRIHDATPKLGPDLTTFFVHKAPQCQQLAQHVTHGSAFSTWELAEHSGAHVDAPYHFDPEGLPIDAVPVDALFFRQFKKFDLTVDDPQPGQPVELGQLIAAAERGGFTLEDDDVAILEFGWDRYLLGGAEDRGPSWWGANEPGLSEDACEYLATADISAVACDTAACDVSVLDGEIIGAPGHIKHFLPNGILIVEGLRGLSNVPATGQFVALPLPLENGSGSPVRVLLLSD